MKTTLMGAAALVGCGICCGDASAAGSLVLLPPEISGTITAYASGNICGESGGCTNILQNPSLAPILNTGSSLTAVAPVVEPAWIAYLPNDVNDPEGAFATIRATRAVSERIESWEGFPNRF